jgi:hypothetical protein
VRPWAEVGRVNGHVGDRADFERKTTFCLKDASEIGAKFRPNTRRDRLGAALCSKDQMVVEASVGVRHDLALEVEFGSVAPFRGFAAIRTRTQPSVCTLG